MLNSSPLTPEPFETSGVPSADPSDDSPSRLDETSLRQLDLNYHRIRCTICSHPEREAIEHDFLHWVRPSVITHEYQLGDRRAIGRHARAFGLFELRTAKTQHALDLIIEKAESVTPTANDIIRAVRAHACLDENGRWHEPIRRVITTHETPTVDPSSHKSVALQASKSVPLQTRKSVAPPARKSIGTPAGKNPTQVHAPQRNSSNQ